MRRQAAHQLAEPMLRQRSDPPPNMAKGNRGVARPEPAETVASEDRCDQQRQGDVGKEKPPKGEPTECTQTPSDGPEVGDRQRRGDRQQHEENDGCSVRCVVLAVGGCGTPEFVNTPKERQ